MNDIQRTDGQCAIQRQFHIAGARCLFPGGEDLLGQIRHRNHLFSERHAVIRHENSLQPILNLTVVIDLVRHLY